MESGLPLTTGSIESVRNDNVSSFREFSILTSRLFDSLIVLWSNCSWWFYWFCTVGNTVRRSRYFCRNFGSYSKSLSHRDLSWSATKGVLFHASRSKLSLVAFFELPVSNKGFLHVFQFSSIFNIITFSSFSWQSHLCKLQIL